MNCPRQNLTLVSTKLSPSWQPDADSLCTSTNTNAEKYIHLASHKITNTQNYKYNYPQQNLALVSTELSPSERPNADPLSTSSILRMPAIVRRCSHNFYRNLNPEATYRSSVILWGHNFVNWCAVEREEGSVLIAPKYLTSQAMFVNTYFYFWYWKGGVTKSKYSKSLILTACAYWEMVFVVRSSLISKSPPLRFSRGWCCISLIPLGQKCQSHLTRRQRLVKRPTVYEIGPFSSPQVSLMMTMIWGSVP